MSKLKLRDDGMCFACGRRNADGLRLEFVFQDGEASTTVSFPKKYQGYRDVVHGGLISTVLDETMVTLLNKMGHLAVTAELSVRFLSPVAVDQPIRVKARLLEQRGKIFRVVATATGADGAEVATAESKCIWMGTIAEASPTDVE